MVIISMKKHSALGEKNKNKAGLRFFHHHYPRTSAVVAAASSASLRSCCRISLIGRLSRLSSLLHPTLCASSGHLGGRRLQMSPHPDAPLHHVCVRDRSAGQRRFQLTLHRINSPLDSGGSNISINQNTPPPPPPLSHSLSLYAKVI